MNKGKLLVFMDKHRIRLALIIALPVIIFMFWMMYSAGVKHNVKKQQQAPQEERRVVAPAEPLEMKTKTQPDITVVLGLKKPIPQKKQEESMIVQNQPAAPVAGEQKPQAAPDPYPDSR